MMRSRTAREAYRHLALMVLLETVDTDDRLGEYKSWGAEAIIEQLGPGWCKEFAIGRLCDF